MAPAGIDKEIDGFLNQLFNFLDSLNHSHIKYDLWYT